MAGLTAAGVSVAVAGVTQPNPVKLKAVGPISSEHGFPSWYEDSNGVRLEQCLDITDRYCDPAFLMGEMPNGDAPINFPDNWPLESFYYSAGSVMDTPDGGKAILVSALEATMANEAAVDGDQVVFGRLRFDIDFPGAGTYAVTHPYGVDNFTVDAAEADNFRYVEDITPAPGNLALALKSRISPFLVRAGGLITTPAGDSYVGDPLVETKVTGSPVDTNFFMIEQIQADGSRTTVAQTDLFNLMGKVWTNSGVTADKAVVNEVGGERFLDVFANTDPGDSISVTGDGLAKTTLAAHGDRYFARIPLVANAPAQVTVTNESDRPVASKTVPVTDDVVISSAVYDTNAQTLQVTAASTDQVDPPTLMVEDVTDGDGAPVPVVGGEATVSLVAPPATVTVTSSEGGQAPPP